MQQQAHPQLHLQQHPNYICCRGSMPRSQLYAASDAHHQETASTSSTESIGASMVNRFQALQSSTASGSMASDSEAAASPSEGGGAHDADMEFAMKLQEEEDRIHYERMLQMAGIGSFLCHASYITVVFALCVQYLHVAAWLCLMPCSTHRSQQCQGMQCCCFDKIWVVQATLKKMSTCLMIL